MSRNSDDGMEAYAGDRRSRACTIRRIPHLTDMPRESPFPEPLPFEPRLVRPLLIPSEIPPKIR
ncbi:MAG: hypothetical protein IJJ33_07715 [Victivallales bacterium]|nr:hypothetical protein [Victivallales bacterium]